MPDEPTAPTPNQESAATSGAAAFHEAPFVAELFPDLPKVEPAQRHCTLENYVECIERRHSNHPSCLRDARRNWYEFERNRELFTRWVRHYQEDPLLQVNGKSHNPEGTLSGMVWLMQRSVDPTRTQLFPCLDFEEKFQKVFIRRGLICYLSLLLKELPPRE